MHSYKRILFVAAISLGGLVLLGTLVAVIYKNEVKEFVVEAINKNLTAKAEVGDISFSMIRNFPYATVEFKNVVIKEPADFTTTGHVLNAESVSLLFSLKSIFNKNYQLKKIVLTNASINIQIDEDGNNNYNIWKNNDERIPEKDIAVELEEVLFINVDVLYYNQLKNQDIDFNVKEGELQGDFKSDRFVLKSKADLLNTSVEIDNVIYISDATCSITLSLDINKSEGSYTFRESGIKISGFTLAIAGTIKTAGDNLDLDLKINSPSADLPSLLTLIPEKYHGNSTGYNYSGRVQFDGSIKGRSGKRISPTVAFSFKCIDVNLNPKGTPYHLKKINGSGYFTNRKNNSSPFSYLRLENFSSLLEGKPIKIDLEIENFKKPSIRLQASVQADLNALSRFFKPEMLEEISGMLHADISFSGIADEKSTYQSSGSIRLNRVNFKLAKRTAHYNDFNGLIQLQGNHVLVQNLSGKTGTSDFTLTGSFNNLVAFILLEGQSVDIKTSLVSTNIDLDEIMLKDTTFKEKDEVIYQISFSDKLKFTVEATIGSLKFKKFNATSIKGVIALESKVLMTKDLNFNTAGGSVRLKGAIDNRKSGTLNINYDALVNKLNVNSLFYEMGNFGQKVLVDKNLKGIVTAEVQFRSVWTDKLELDENSIYAKSDITIENGELINFDPMLALSRFLKGTDLRTIKFSTITNTIEIKNRKIYIPLMEIKSTAIDITASGEHTFDNIVDYKLRLYLSQILGKQVKDKNTEFGTIEDDGLGRPMIYLSMKGPASDPKFSWDRNSVEKKITQEIKNETKTIKTLLKEEFGKKDPNPTVKSDKKRHQELQIDYDDE